MEKFTYEHVRKLLKLQPIIEAELLLSQARVYGLDESEVPTEIRNEQMTLERQLKHIDSLYAVLSEDEQFVVRRHLIDGLDFERIAREHNNKWGEESEKTARSFQVNLTKGIRRMVAFINSRSDLETFQGMLLQHYKQQSDKSQLE